MPTAKPQVVFTLPFQTFWSWLRAHPNCILRAGTPEVVLFDDDDFHWHLDTDPEDGAYLVQVIAGKKLVGELAVTPAEITYVQAEPGENDEFRFELVTESADTRLAAYHFVMSHGYDEEDEPSGQKRYTH
ncbi:MAG TPA: hypothetical protein VKE22_14850 [Haliangiales bacterium]|nr:hypothetical protein [Haliangiales bacterium]